MTKIWVKTFCMLSTCELRRALRGKLSTVIRLDLLITFLLITPHRNLLRCKKMQNPESRFPDELTFVTFAQFGGVCLGRLCAMVITHCLKKAHIRWESRFMWTLDTGPDRIVSVHAMAYAPVYSHPTSFSWLKQVWALPGQPVSSLS